MRPFARATGRGATSTSTAMLSQAERGEGNNQQEQRYGEPHKAPPTNRTKGGRQLSLDVGVKRILHRRSVTIRSRCVKNGQSSACPCKVSRAAPRDRVEASTFGEDVAVIAVRDGLERSQLTFYPPGNASTGSLELRDDGGDVVVLFPKTESPNAIHDCGQQSLARQVPMLLKRFEQVTLAKFFPF